MSDLDLISSYLTSDNSCIIHVNIDVGESFLIKNNTSLLINLRNIVEVQLNDRGYFYSRHNIGDFENNLIPLLKKYKLYDKLLILMEKGVLG